MLPTVWLPTASQSNLDNRQANQCPEVSRQHRLARVFRHERQVCGDDDITKTRQGHTESPVATSSWVVARFFANGAGGITCLSDGMSSARASNIMAESAPAPCHNVCEERAKCRPASTYSLPRAMPTPTPENSAARTKRMASMLHDER